MAARPSSAIARPSGVGRRRPAGRAAARWRGRCRSGILGAVAALLGAILVLATRDFGFSVDIEHLYDAAFPDRDEPEIFLVRIAESHRQRRVDNRDGVRALQRFLVSGLFGVVLEVSGFATALAVH